MEGQAGIGKTRLPASVAAAGMLSPGGLQFLVVEEIIDLLEVLSD